MGLGPPVIALYHQLKTLGVFDGVKDVMELGSQNVWCPQANIMRGVIRSIRSSAAIRNGNPEFCQLDWLRARSL